VIDVRFCAAPSFAATQSFLFDWDFSQCNALDGGPDDHEATHLGGEHVNLIGALTNIPIQALDGVGGADIAVHRLGSSRKRSGFCLPPQPSCAPPQGRVGRTWL